MQRASEPMPAWWKKRWEDLTPAEKDEVREYIRQLRQEMAEAKPAPDAAVLAAARRRGKP